MAKQTKALSGPAKLKFLRAIVRAEPDVAPAAADRLLARLDAGISQLRVRHHAASRPQPLIDTRQVDDSSHADDAPPATAAAVFEPATSPAAPEPAFDPHAFSLIVVMTKQGAAGLMQRLEGIVAADQLRALARAQHIAIDLTATGLDELRQAIVDGTRQRIADRRAAAS